MNLFIFIMAFIAGFGLAGSLSINARYEGSFKIGYQLLFGISIIFASIALIISSL